MTPKKILLAGAALLAFTAAPLTAMAQDPGNWTLGFTAYLNDGLELPCPDVAGVTPQGAVPDDGVCRLAGGVYTEDMTFFAGNDYVLQGQVFIGEDVGFDGLGGDPADLRIGAGVNVLGAVPTAFLVISRGSRIFANGSALEPVVFAPVGYELQDIDTATGLWGGLIVNGRATINLAGGEGEGEFASGLYGGPDDDDNSGILKYVQVFYAGFSVDSLNETNGIGFQGVGRGTEVDFIQVHNGNDDAVEFFGGTVNAKHLVLTGSRDDGFDWTHGWRGKAQHVIIVQNPNTGATDDPRGIEADNLSGAENSLPRSNPMLANFTMVGPEGDSDWPGNHGVVLRRGTGGHLMNFVVSEFELANWDIDGGVSYGLVGGDLVIESSLAGNDANAAGQAGAFALDDGDSDDTLPGIFAANNNLVAVPTLAAPAGGGKPYINGATENGMTAKDPSTVDAFFDSVDYVGAVENAAGNWADGWTVWLDN